MHPQHYLRDPEAIYRQSFETVQRETDLSCFAADEVQIVERIVHSCGMPDIVSDLRFSPGAVRAAMRALSAGAPIISDCRMVEVGLTVSGMPSASPVLCFLDDPAVSDRAGAERTTRSAAQVPLWRDHQGGAVIAVGNAPTALFRLIEEIRNGAPMPALVAGFPVGFVGASEAKQMLVEAVPAIPYIALLGRRGGSAMAAAAVNALIRLSAGVSG